MILFAYGLNTASKSQTLVENYAAIKAAKDDASGARPKHTDITNHLIRELVKKKTIFLSSCPGAKIIADIFTKPLQKNFILGACKNDGCWKIRSIV